MTDEEMKMALINGGIVPKWVSVPLREGSLTQASEPLKTIMQSALERNCEALEEALRSLLLAVYAEGCQESSIMRASVEHAEKVLGIEK